MMAVIKNEVIEPAFPHGDATALPAEHNQARDLNERELDEVSGGAANLISGGIGAGLGGLAGGARYALNTAGRDNFSWGTFAQETVRVAVSGFLIGSGSPGDSNACGCFHDGIPCLWAIDSRLEAARIVLSDERKLKSSAKSSCQPPFAPRSGLSYHPQHHGARMTLKAPRHGRKE